MQHFVLGRRTEEMLSTPMDQRPGLVPPVLVLTILLLVCSSCRRFELATATLRTDGRIEFSSKRISAGSKPGVRLAIAQVSVVRRDCSVDCVMWEAYRFVRDQPFTADESDLWPVIYGTTIPRAKQAVPPRPLVSGKYEVSLTVSELEGAQEQAVHHLLGKFSLEMAEGSVIGVTQLD